MGKRGKTHMLDRGDEESGGDADALLNVVVVTERAVGKVAVPLLKKDHEPGHRL